MRDRPAASPRIASAFALTLAVLVADVGRAAAQAPPAPRELVETTHQIAIDGKTIEYVARAGFLPIRANETGAVEGRVFFTHYAIPPAPGAPARPLTFLWNGGPGASSAQLHLLGVGPRRVRTPDAPLDPPEREFAVVDNDGTWLGATDLVFVDPIGTGFSRATDASQADRFYGVRADVACVAEFVRLFLTRFDAWDQPLFVGGESYGTWRAAGVARNLVLHGIRLAGVILISGGVPIGPVETEESRVAHLIPARTAAAFFHRRLAPNLLTDLDDTLARAEEWAAAAYAPALARRATLPESEREAVVHGLARWTGLPLAAIDRDSLVIDRARFGELLLAADSRVLGTFDTRMTSDASDAPAAALDASVVRYLRDELGFVAAEPYAGIESDRTPDGPSARWRWDHAETGAAAPERLTQGDGPPGARPAWLRDALERDPRPRVFVATGHFDSLNSDALDRHVVSLLPAALAKRFTLAAYPGGHMMYLDAPVRRALQADAARFIIAAAGPARPAIEHSVLAARDAVVTDDVAVTRHAVRIDGREVAYTARAGTLPLRDAASGAVRANLFFVSYSVAPEPGAPPRPILFAWNGGPGSNAALLHLTAMGPKRLAMDDVYATADPDTMASIVDNEATWLGAADLVFVDPVGTGYSRPTSAEFGAAFYDVLGDVESIADFIRDYRERFGATRAPLILSGESYGSLRAASVARGLLARGIRTDGIVFISGSPGLADVPPQLEPALLLPSLTATALYHRKLATDLAADPERTIEEARRFANGAYADALGRPDALAADERTRIRASLARFTGLPLDAIDAESLAVAMPEFATRLLAGDGRVLGRYDARLSRPRRAVEGDFDPLDDPSLTPIEFTVGGNAPAFLRYLRSELGWRSDLYYVGPFGGAWPPPASERGDWMTIRWHWVDGPTAPLNDVLAANPNLVVLHASGRYDLTSPAGPPARQIASLPAALAARFTVRVYEGGHSFYLDRASRLAFAKDGARLIEAAAAAAR